MKVVLFCGGLGMRMREYSESVPKPMVKIGYRPILWHIMKYYAHYGHRDFVLCLGWKGNVIKDYFLHYREELSNDFVLTQGGGKIDLLASDIEDWKITFCDTGISSSIGERLHAVREHLDGEETFLANYTDGLCDVDLDQVVGFHRSRQSSATFLSVRPTQSFHSVIADEDGRVRHIQDAHSGSLYINGGFFVLGQEIFEHLGPGRDIIDDALSDLIQRQQCFSMKYDGFWGCMDTYKEFQELQELHDRGPAPWAVWEQSAAAAHHSNASSQPTSPPSSRGSRGGETPAWQRAIPR